MIIGLNGKIGAGKDTVADYLVENYGFRKVGFSDVMYDAVEALWDISHEEALEFKDPALGVSAGIYDSDEISLYDWRVFLQRFGTEMGRNVFGEDFWVDQFEQKYLQPDGMSDLVVRDVRFNNEAKMLSQYDGQIWEIVRPEHEGDSHVSEAGIHEGHIVGDIVNDGTLEELYAVLGDWMEDCYGRTKL